MNPPRADVRFGRRAAARVGIAFVALWVVVFLLLDQLGPMERDWGLDEGQRTAESYFWGLIRQGHVSHPDWFREVTIRSHPPVNKYLFGLAIQLHGFPVPADLRLAQAYDRGAPANSMPAPFEEPYRPLRRPVRRAALACNVGSALVVVFLAWRWAGFLAATLAAGMVGRHYLYTMLLFSARSDAVQTFAATATAVPLWLTWRSPNASWKSALLRSTVTGVLAALSFQTRVSGLLALAAAAVVYLVLWLRTRSLKIVVLALVAVGVTLVVGTAINPYYWAQPSPDPGIPIEYRQDRPLPLRVARNYWLQYEDLRRLLAGQGPEWRLRSPGPRSAFVSSVLLSGISGKMIGLGMVLAIVIVVARRTRAPEHLLFSTVWGGAMVSGFTSWIPLAWEPYVLMAFPAAVLIASSGWGALINEMAALPSVPHFRTALAKFARRPGRVEHDAATRAQGATDGRGRDLPRG